MRDDEADFYTTIPQEQQCETNFQRSMSVLSESWSVIDEEDDITKITRKQSFNTPSPSPSPGTFMNSIPSLINNNNNEANSTSTNVTSSSNSAPPINDLTTERDLTHNNDNNNIKKLSINVNNNNNNEMKPIGDGKASTHELEQSTSNLPLVLSTPNFLENSSSSSSSSNNSGPGSRSSKELRMQLLPGEKQLYRVYPVGLDGLTTKEKGALFLTNYQIVYQIVSPKSPQPVVLITIPLAMVANIEENNTSQAGSGHYNTQQGGNLLSSSTSSVSLECKDFRDLRFIFYHNSQNMAHSIYKCLKRLIFPDNCVKNIFAFHYKERYQDVYDGWTVYDPFIEYSRQGATFTPDPKWRISDVNANFEVCNSYPRYFVVPFQITDQELRRAAEFRTKGRIPLLSWRHPTNNACLCRSSQPHVGLSRSRCKEDERLVKAIQVASVGPNKTLFIIDLRPKTAALANGLMGKGYEVISNYDNCKLQFMGIENIHAMRDSLFALRRLCQPDKNLDPYWLSNLEATGWLEHIRLIMSSAVFVVDILDKQGSSVLLHCSDGFDRTSQLSALCQLLLDPFYRTIHGFQVLIEKDWLSFGHKFHDRCCHLKKVDDQYSPIFLQWIDCVWQLTQQFPRAFEFNEALLIEVIDSLFSCKYGTFLFNCVREREAHGLHQNTMSLWTAINQRLDEFRNPFYMSNPGVLIPDSGPKHIQLWSNYYLRYNRLISNLNHVLNESSQHLKPSYNEKAVLHHAYSDLEKRMREMEKQYEQEHALRQKLESELGKVKHENSEYRKALAQEYNAHYGIYLQQQQQHGQNNQQQHQQQHGGSNNAYYHNHHHGRHHHNHHLNNNNNNVHPPVLLVPVVEREDLSDGDELVLLTAIDVNESESENDSASSPDSASAVAGGRLSNTGRPPTERWQPFLEPSYYNNANNNIINNNNDSGGSDSSSSSTTSGNTDTPVKKLVERIRKLSHHHHHHYHDSSSISSSPGGGGGGGGGLFDKRRATRRSNSTNSSIYHHGGVSSAASDTDIDDDDTISRRGNIIITPHGRAKLLQKQQQRRQQQQQQAATCTCPTATQAAVATPMISTTTTPVTTTPLTTTTTAPIPTPTAPTTTPRDVPPASVSLSPPEELGLFDQVAMVQEDYFCCG